MVDRCEEVDAFDSKYVIEFRYVELHEEFGRDADGFDEITADGDGDGILGGVTNSSS